MERVNPHLVRGGKRQGLLALLFLFVSFGNHRLSDHLSIAE